VQVKLSVSSRGLIALPAAMRKAAVILPQDSIIAESTTEGILLRPAVTLPVELYTSEQIAEFDAAESGLEQAVERAGRPTRPDWSARADEALERATLRVREIAIQTNTGIFVMIDVKMVTITAGELRAERENRGA